EVRISEAQARRALSILVDKEIVETRVFRFNGSPTVHIRIRHDGFFEAWEKVLAERERKWKCATTQNGPANAPERSSICATTQMEHAETGESLTETTAEITAEKPESSEGAGAPVQESDPSTYQEWAEMLEHPRQYGSNRPAILRRMFEHLYPGKEPPTYSYVGRVAQGVGGAGRLAELLWQHSTRPPTGDVLAYIQGVAKRSNGRNGNGNGKQRQDADTTTDFEALAYAEMKAWEKVEEAQRAREQLAANN
ncbi:MAG: hypothetical protein JXQ75_12050, partial [Phycisphaerae bacterium]|nr:hypothetical protein [Phycisphaerae bacterium]